jgi:hypothetical protein
MSAPASSRWDSQVRLLAWLATCVSVLSFLFYFRHGDVVLYGDAEAHINIARRVFDSKTPGLLQLGTVWLPLPHLLMVPFLISDEMWRSGAGGSIPSMVAYVFGVIGMFRMMLGALRREGESETAPKIAAWIAAVVYAANPNLIYMQTTAMGEAIFLALFVWAVVYFSEFARGDVKALVKCALCLAAACLTRYDGWFLTIATVAAVAIVVVVSGLRAEREHSISSLLSPLRHAAFVKFILIAAAAPALWLAYNAIVYRNPLEFENGPYSAKAIERKTQSVGSPGHPGSGNPVVAGLYFLKAAEANVADNGWLQRFWLVLVLVGVAAANPYSRKRHGDGTQDFVRRLPLLLLWVPLPFYALSVAYGGVPIFIPAWWPFSHYNVRYGLQLLPAFAAGLALLVYVVLRSSAQRNPRRAVFVGAIALVVVSYGSVWRAGPICHTEAAVNMRTRIALEKQLVPWLHALPPDSTLLMYLGGFPGAVQQAGIPLRRVINEGNHRVWMQPSDPEGLWERALAAPAANADYVLAFEGDSVWQALQGKHLKELVEINVTGQPRAILYRAR